MLPPLALLPLQPLLLQPGALLFLFALLPPAPLLRLLLLALLPLLPLALLRLVVPRGKELSWQGVPACGGMFSDQGIVAALLVVVGPLRQIVA